MERTNTESTCSKRSGGWRLVRRRECWTLTWPGWTVLVIAVLLSLLVAMRTVHGFLSVTAPLDTKTLVAEGWMQDFAARAVEAEFRRGQYSVLYVTGGPLERGEPLSEYKTYAELGEATLQRLGLPPDSVHAVPAPEVRKDRTFASAMALKKWLLSHGGVPRAVNVVSVGPHARRTRLLYERAFGSQTRIGIIAVANPNYDPRHWWQSSIGMRQVVDETVAYLYARFLFRPENG